MYKELPLQANPPEEPEGNPTETPSEQLTKQGRHKLKKQRKQEERKKAQRKGAIKKTIATVLTVLVVGAGIFGFGWFLISRPSFPPTSMQNHIEQSPPSHIVDRPIPANIQKHMLEHADGGGKPGIVIQYNCDDYDCSPDLVEKLTELVKQYPNNVYLAPNNYDGKIILTKLRKREILDTFDEQAIRTFIEQ